MIQLITITHPINESLLNIFSVQELGQVPHGRLREFKTCSQSSQTLAQIHKTYLALNWHYLQGTQNITPVRAGACGGQVVRRVSAQVSHVSQWVPEPVLGSFPSSGMHNWNGYAQKQAESPQWFPDLWRKGYYSKKGQTEATRTASN